MGVSADQVAAVRDFNRFYTGVIGVLNEGLVDTPYTLTEARILFELAQREETESLALRRTLDLDPGYLSRILARFESDGLVERARAGGDGRRRIVQLTAQGRASAARLDERSAAEVAALLDTLTDDGRSRLLSALRTVQTTLAGERTRAPILRPLGPGDLGWVVERNGLLYDREVGWNRDYEALVAGIVSAYVRDLDPSRENAWIAEVDGDRAGAVFCCRSAEGESVAQLRLLHVEPDARGLGVGAALVGECVRFATEAGYTQMMLWTTELQKAAHRIYQRAGFVLETREAPVHRFGDTVHGQIWRRPL